MSRERAAWSGAAQAVTREWLVWSPKYPERYYLTARSKEHAEQKARSELKLHAPNPWHVAEVIHRKDWYE